MYIGDVNQGPRAERPTDAGEPAQGIDLLQLLRGMWRRKLMMLLVIITITGAVLAWLMVTPSRYVAEAQVLIESGETAFTSVEGDRPPGPVDDLSVQSEVEVIKSRDLALEVMRTLNLADVPGFADAEEPSAVESLLVGLGLLPDPASISQQDRLLESYFKRLTVQPIKESRVIAIQFKDSDADRAANLGNELARQYIASTRESRLDTTRQAINWLSEQITSLRTRTTASESEVEKLRNRAGLIKGRTDTLQSQELSELNSQLILAAAARSEAKAQAVAIRNLLESQGDVASATDVLQSNLIQRLVEQKVRLKAQIADLSTTLLPSHPRMIRFAAELRGLDQQIRSEARKIVESLENRAKVAGAREASLRASLEALKSRATTGIDEDVQLRALEREATSNRNLLESLLKRYREATARAEIEAQPAGARIVAHAIAPSTPNSPKRLPILGLGFVGSIILAGVFAFLAEIFSMTAQAQRQPAMRMMPAHEFDRDDEPAAPDFDKKADARPATGLGAVDPEFDTKKRAKADGNETADANDVRGLDLTSNIAAVDTPREGEGIAAGGVGSEFVIKSAGKDLDASMFDDIADALVRRHKEENAKRFLIAAMPDLESRPAAIAALGRKLALLGHKCVLLDADFEAPCLDLAFDLDGREGLAELLVGKRAFADVLTADSVSGLDLVSSGQERERAAELVNSERMEIVLDALNYAYDIVLVNAAVPGEGNAARALLDGADMMIGFGEASASGKAWVRELDGATTSAGKAPLFALLKESEGLIAKTLARGRRRVDA